MLLSSLTASSVSGSRSREGEAERRLSAYTFLACRRCRNLAASAILIAGETSRPRLPVMLVVSSGKVSALLLLFGGKWRMWERKVDIYIILKPWPSSTCVDPVCSCVCASTRGAVRIDGSKVAKAGSHNLRAVNAVRRHSCSRRGSGSHVLTALTCTSSSSPSLSRLFLARRSHQRNPLPSRLPPRSVRIGRHVRFSKSVPLSVTSWLPTTDGTQYPLTWGVKLDILCG